MASEPLSKRAKTSKDATSPTVSVGGVIFTPELIARITTFADAISYPDVMNICLAVGPVVSRTIKHFYLRRNKEYLIDTLKKPIYYGASKAGTNHRAWMEVNADWKTTAVSDDSVSVMSWNQLHYNIMNGSRPFIAFNSVAFAVELGLLEVVKFLIEDKGVDPNEYGQTFWNHSTHRLHLVSAAMTSGQQAIFQYLLSLPSTDLYSEIDDSQARKRNHGLFEQALDVYLRRKKTKAYLTSLINHNRFDVNRACHRYSKFPTSDFACLYIALYRLEKCLYDFADRYGPTGGEDPDLAENDSECLDRHINAIKLLLEAGANPTQNELQDTIGNVIDHVGWWLRVLQPNVGSYSIRLLRERVYRQLLTMMREAKLPEARAIPLLQQSNIDL